MFYHVGSCQLSGWNTDVIKDHWKLISMKCGALVFFFHSKHTLLIQVHWYCTDSAAWCDIFDFWLGCTCRLIFSFTKYIFLSPFTYYHFFLYKKMKASALHFSVDFFVKYFAFRMRWTKLGFSFIDTALQNEITSGQLIEKCAQFSSNGQTK